MGKVFKLEFARHMNKFTLGVIAAVLILSIGILQIGISQYKNTLFEKEEFIHTEVERVDHYINYHVYAAFGFWRMNVPTPIISIFYNSKPFKGIIAFIEGGVRFKIMNLRTKQMLFDKSTGGSLDISWFLFIIGLVIVLPWGFFLFRNKILVRLLKNFTSTIQVFFGVILGRAAIIILTLVMIFVQIYGQFFLNGIVLDFDEIKSLFIFLMLTFFVWMIMLVFSAAFGATKKWKKGMIQITLFAIAFFIIWPEVFNSIFSNHISAVLKSSYQHESQKVRILMDFERVAFERSNRYKKIENKINSDAIMSKRWRNEELKKIEYLEEEILKSTKDCIKDFHLLSIHHPITFYRGCNNELSSLGFNSFENFFKENLIIYKGFINFCFENRTRDAYANVSPYLKLNEMTSISKTSLPNYFIFGLFVSLIYLVMALFICFYRMKAYMNCSYRKAKKGRLKIDFRKGETVVIAAGLREEIDMFAAGILSGFPSTFPVECTIDGVPFNQKDLRIVYFPDPGSFPVDCRLKTLGSIAGLKKSLPEGKTTFGDLTLDEKAMFIFDLLKEREADIFVLEKFPGYFDSETASDIQAELDDRRPSDSIVLCLDSQAFNPLSRDRMMLVYMMKDPVEYKVIPSGRSL